MRQYVTAIMVAVSHNTAIPLAFAWGRVEDSDLYELFFSAFSEEFEIDLSSFLLESDQGSGLAKFCRKHGFTQRFCLRHFVATLKDRVFSVFVNQLVKTRTETEFDVLRESQRPLLHHAICEIEADGLARANKEFGKAGLIIQYTPADGLPFVTILDALRWDQVSSIRKIAEGIPMTTNCLESINGHRNAATPRRNTFWGALSRIAQMFGRSMGNFGGTVRNNFNNTTRRAMSLAQSLGDIEMDAQCVYYKTNTQAETCDCGLCEYFSRMFDRPVPCCHLIHKGLVRPCMLNPPILRREVDPVPFNLDLVSIMKTRPEEPSVERRDHLVAMAASSIKHLSRTGVRMEEVKRWVDRNMPEQVGTIRFVQNIPLGVLTFIQEGVLHYGGGISDD
jgi:hypothetical protein